MASGFIPRSLDAISRAIRGDLRRELPGTDATVWPNTLSIFSKVVAMAIRLVEFRAEYIYRQIFASTADRRHLERQAYEFGLSRKPASSAIGKVLTTGTPGAVYPAGIAYLSGAEIFRTSSDARVADNGDVVFLVHSEGVGVAMNRAEGDVINLADTALYPTLGPIATVVTGGLGGGADTEDDDSLRARILDRKRRPPQGGAYSDYEQFARNVPGVVKAWAWPFADGPGTVGVWFLFAGRPDLIPTWPDIMAVQEELDSRRLIRASVSVSAPLPAPVDIVISGLARDTDTTRADIEASLSAMFFERSRPGVAIEPFVLSRSWIAEAISQAVGEDRHVLTEPLVDLVFIDGQYPVLGQVTYA